MSEPLADDQLREYRDLATDLHRRASLLSVRALANWLDDAANSTESLLAEVERLKVREADLVADIELLGKLSIEMVRALEQAGLSATAAAFNNEIGDKHGKRGTGTI